MTTSRSATLVRRWVALYTRGLPADIRDARREEIAADLWSQAQDAERIDGSTGAPSDEVLGRLLFGLWADVTWRLEQRHRHRTRQLPRTLSTGTRILAALAIIGGATLAAGSALTLALVAAAPDGTWSTVDYNAIDFIVSRVVYNVGLVLVSIALWGLIFRFQDRMREGVALAGVVGGFGGMVSAMGAYTLLLLLLAGSAVVTGGLSWFGALPRSLAVVHAVAAVAFFAVVAASVINWQTLAHSPMGALGILVLPYPLTWIAIGVALHRGQPAPDQTRPAPGTP
jgi:hypothetical protein